MKKTTKLFAGILISTMLMFAGCVQNNNPSGPATGNSDSTISGELSLVISPVSESVDIKDEALGSYDYTQLFTVTNNGVKVDVQDSWIDTSALSTTPGQYTVRCSYQGVSATIQVNVIKTVYELTLSVTELTMHKTLSENYDFLALFSATKDGEPFALSQDMVSTDLAAQEGTYTYTVTVKGVSKTLTIHLTNEHSVFIVNTYPNLEIAQSDLATFDYTKLFSLYVNGTQTQVTLDMIDTSSLQNATVGNRYAVVMTFAKDATTESKTAYVHIKADDAIVLNAKNVITAPNSEFIDLTTLFEIKQGDTNIPVTSDMITGAIDYSQVGENVITLTYAGQTKTAIVEVKRGAIIDYKTSNVVTIKKGTDQDAYLFANDFVLTINGIRFTGIDGYIDTTAVDFDTVGSYTATLTVPYNEKKFGLSGVSFTYITADITYVVVENDYALSVKAEHVELPVGTTQYNVYNNLSLSINGKNQSFTNNKNYVDIITCYAELLSEPIDFTKVAAQEVRIAVYANGVDNEPVIVSYTLQIQSNVTVTAIDKVIYANETLFTTGLFTITEDGEEVTPTYEMIVGKVDVFTPGAYTVDIDYKGVKAQAKVIVLDNAIKGVYKTNLETIAETSSDYDEEYGDEVAPTTRLKNMVIDEDGNITVDGRSATILKAIDQNTLLLKIKSYEYTMYVSNGIVVLDPDNAIRLGYNNDKRPMIYFDDEIWTLEQRVTINYGSTYVLNATYSGHYSIDAFKITSKATQQSMWYGLKVRLAEKSGGDTIYTVEWGEVQFADDFEQKAGVTSSLTICEQTFKFTMSSATVGAVKAEVAEKKYVNMSFTGMLNGEAAQLKADQYEGFGLYVGTTEIFKVGSLEISEMKNGGVNYAEDSLFLYAHEREEFFSYKFLLDVENKTFTIEEGDGMLGLYETDGMYIFLDGYGTGVVNFNTKSYYKTQFTYNVYDQKVEIRYINTSPSFAYGTGATLFVDGFGNTLTAADFIDETFSGEKFVNSHISKGALVNISSYKIGADSDSVAKAKLYDNVEIVTKDGTVLDADKKSYIDTSRIRFNTPGFYQMTITIDGVTSYYAIQILEAAYEGNPMVATWGAGVMFHENSLLIDKYGQVFMSISGTIYQGDARISDTSFTVVAHTEGKSITLTGTQIAPGLISVRCGGSVVFNDYFTTGAYTQSGTNGFVLRGFTCGTETVYIYSKNATSLGEIVSVECLSSETLAVGTIFKVVTSNSEIVAKMVSLSNLESGVVLADAYRGTYTVEDSSLFIDGFGAASVDGVSGKYELSGRTALITLSGEYKVYRLDNANFTATLLDIALDNSLINGNTYTSTHYFLCGDYMYEAETTFIFGNNGVVTVKSTSSSHDGGEDACATDSYAPTFASAEGVKGTYLVQGNQITVNVGGETFVFKIANVANANQYTCVSTTVENGEHGQFQTGTLFQKI